jgi:hypothetical protein
MRLGHKEGIPMICGMFTGSIDCLNPFVEFAGFSDTFECEGLSDLFDIEGRSCSVGGDCSTRPKSGMLNENRLVEGLSDESEFSRARGAVGDGGDNGGGEIGAAYESEGWDIGNAS